MTDHYADYCCKQFKRTQSHEEHCPIYELLEHQASILVAHRQYELGILSKMKNYGKQ